MTVLRAAARARADKAMVADEMDAAAAAREAAGEAAIASAFARAMAADQAHSDRRLVAVANAVQLAEYAPLLPCVSFVLWLVAPYFSRVREMGFSLGNRRMDVPAGTWQLHR